MWLKFRLGRWVGVRGDAQRCWLGQGLVSGEPHGSYSVKASLPPRVTSLAFLTPGATFMEGRFPTDQGRGGDGFRMTGAHTPHLLLTLCYYYDISPTQTSRH